jgi:hypothetical protein
MRRRILEWGWIVALLLSIGLAVLWADSLPGKRRYDVLSLARSLNILVADGRVTFFRGGNELGLVQPRVLNPRGFGQNMPREHPYFDWKVAALGVRYRLVTGEVSIAGTEGTLAGGMGPLTIRYAEFTIPGLSYHRHHEVHLSEAPWSLELTLLIPLVLLLVILGLSGHLLRKGRRPPDSSPPTTPKDSSRLYLTALLHTQNRIVDLSYPACVSLGSFGRFPLSTSPLARFVRPVFLLESWWRASCWSASQFAGFVRPVLLRGVASWRLLARPVRGPREATSRLPPLGAQNHRRWESAFS